MNAAAGAVDPIETERRRAERSARWYYARLPLLGLVVLLGIGVPPALLGRFDYREVMPLVLILSAIVVMFVGAWFDFGAKRVVHEILVAKAPFVEDDLVHIHRQQLLLTFCYLGAAGLYVLVALAILAA